MFGVASFEFWRSNASIDGCCIANSLFHFHGWERNPQSLFDWNIGKRNAADRPQPKYHDIDLPFSPSLVNNTFLKGYTNNTFKFGAFNPEGYRSTDDYYDTFDAFLFYWTDNGTIDPIILPKVGGSGAALFDYARGGPQFGADGLLIGPPLAPVMGGFAGPDTNSGIGDLRQAKSRLGLSYAKRADGKESIFGEDPRPPLKKSKFFAVLKLQVYIN
ncbi:hypothetical protein GH714_015582 [Hevea brasiliensis]|uniref:Uncharacterized protein n=1 Tax=Hevea brasiliensis TaxID=3981 RepID=A0A6A6M4Y5_HEVBR|nr:hypothetical protein GH714_015582 [Hevea brasiliensis]